MQLYLIETINMFVEKGLRTFQPVIFKRRPPIDYPQVTTWELMAFGTALPLVKFLKHGKRYLLHTYGL